MPYNDKYFFEFGNLKETNSNVLHYKVVLSILEAVPYVYDLIELQAANSPFILTYRSPEDNAFSPIKTSSAEINILYPYDPATGTPEPDDFFGFDRSYQWQVRFYEVTSSGTIETLKWQGFIIDNDIQYEWQDAYYYRMTATDNLAVIKDLKFTNETEFRCPDYDPFSGVSVAEFITFILRSTGNELNCKFAGSLFNYGNEYQLDALWTSYYNGIDWKNKNPKGNYEILNDLLRALGCIVYLDNADAKWTVLMINEISNRPNNEVPYVEYDFEFNSVGTGFIELNSSINTGDTDLVWRDKNQIVSLKRPINYARLIHKYVPKNLSANYSFQQDLIHTGWTDIGTFSSDVDTLLPTSINYDRNYLVIDSNENTIDPLNVSDYINQTYNFQNSPIADAAGEIFAIYASFTTTCEFQGQGSGYNYQIINTTSVPTTLYFDASQAVNIAQNGGLWVTSTGGRIPVFGSINNGFQRVSCFTKYTVLDNIFNLRFLKYRTANAVAGEYTVDEVIVNITPIAYKGIEDFSYIAAFYYLNKNGLTSGVDIPCSFNGGRGLDYDWYIFEGAIGYKNAFSTFTCGNLWDRYQEAHNEGSFGNLTEITARSILEFYGRTSRKIVGNVYGNQISYPKYFEVQSAVDRGYLTGIANSFEFRVNADAGFTETSLCGSNYLSEYAVKNADFLMVEATFDYSQATTNVNIHEDNSLNTGDNFEVFSGAGATSTGNGVFPESFGGSNNGIVDSEGE